MNIFVKARLEKSIRYPILTDKRAIGLFNLGISNYEYKKLEIDDSYIAHPMTYALLIDFFESYDLGISICENCSIKKIDTSNFDNKYSLYEKEVLKRLNFDKCCQTNKHTYIYHSRIEQAKFNKDLLNRWNIANLTSLSVKKITRLENDFEYIPRFEELNAILKCFGSRSLINEACQRCLVRTSIDKLLEKKGG